MTQADKQDGSGKKHNWCSEEVAALKRFENAVKLQVLRPTYLFKGLYKRGSFALCLPHDWQLGEKSQTKMIATGKDSLLV